MRPYSGCQRTWLCDLVGEPGKTTPFANAACNCPGDHLVFGAVDTDVLTVLTRAEIGVDPREPRG